jgi:nicotinamidase/pyrazinamidase
MSLRKVDLLVIDGQNDFCDPKGSLFVPGADADMTRLSAFITANSKKLNAIHSTLDSHHVFSIFHSIFWMDSTGKHPDPFTLISLENVEKGQWMAVAPGLRKVAVDYVRALTKKGKYLLIIWPEHCLIGTWGTQLFPALSEALIKWEHNNVGMIDFVTKGSNFMTEHYSAVQADVPDPSDASTLLNMPLIKTLDSVDEILFAGEALSHCVAYTMDDIFDNISPDAVKKFVLLTDASSSVGTFEKNGEDFVKRAVARGVRLATTKDYLF